MKRSHFVIGFLIFGLTIVASGCGRDSGKLRQWLADWEKTRACLLPSTEYGPDSRTAFTVSSLFHGASCFQERMSLRYDAEEIRDAIPHDDALQPHLTDLGAYILDGSAIDHVDAHVMRLREIAHLAPIKRAPRRAVASLPIGRTIEVDGEPPTSMSFCVRGRIDAKAVRATQVVVAEITAPDDVRTVVIPLRETLAYPSRRWTARASNGDLTVRELGSEDVTTIAVQGAIEATAAMDSGSTGVVLAESGKLERIAVLKGVAYLVMKVAGTYKFVPLPTV